MTRKATDAVTTMGIDIGKISLHLIGLEGCFGSSVPVHRWLPALPNLGVNRTKTTRFRTLAAGGPLYPGQPTPLGEVRQDRF